MGNTWIIIRSVLTYLLHIYQKLTQAMHWHHTRANSRIHVIMNDYKENVLRSLKCPKLQMHSEFPVYIQLKNNRNNVGNFFALVLKALTISSEYLHVFNEVHYAVPEVSFFDVLLKFQDVFLVASCFRSKM